MTHATTSPRKGTLRTRLGSVATKAGAPAQAQRQTHTCSFGSHGNPRAGRRWLRVQDSRVQRQRAAFPRSPRGQSERPGPGVSHTKALLFLPQCSSEKGLGERPESQKRDHSVACWWKCSEERCPQIVSSWWEKKGLQPVFWAFQSSGSQQCPGHPNGTVRATDKVSSTRTSLTESCSRDPLERSMNVYGVPGTPGVTDLY